jgi:hypothetical protein
LSNKSLIAELLPSLELVCAPILTRRRPGLFAGVSPHLHHVGDALRCRSQQVAASTAWILHQEAPDHRVARRALAERIAAPMPKLQTASAASTPLIPLAQQLNERHAVRLVQLALAREDQYV